MGRQGHSIVVRKGPASLLVLALLSKQHLAWGLRALLADCLHYGVHGQVTTDDRIRMAHIAENEQMRRTVFPACSYRAGRPVDKLFTIIDLEGIAFT